MPHLIRLHLTTLSERSKAGRKREPATGSEHLLVGMKIAIPVLPSIGAYISDEARSCVNDDCFDLLAFSNRKFQSGKKSDFGDFASSSAIVGFFIPVSSLKVFGHSIHSERRRIYLGKSIQALQNDTIIISWVFSFRVTQPTVRWHTFKSFMFVFINSCSS